MKWSISSYTVVLLLLAAGPASARNIGRAVHLPPSELTAIRSIQQAGRITGAVIEELTGEPIQGAQVSVLGTALAVRTDDAGRYVIGAVAPGDHEVRVAFIGYRSQTQTVVIGAGQPTVVNFAMTRSAVGLDEVIVTGSPGATARREIGVAINRIDVATVLEAAPIAKISELLENRAAGAVIMQQGGQVGTGSIIKLRGTGSITLTNQPIIYIDGVRMDNTLNTQVPGGSGPSRWDDINPADIESIEMIKGPAASTLYGTEASNGVVQILTKRGRGGQRSQITASVKQGANWMISPETEFGLNYYLAPDGTVLSQNVYADEQARGFDILRTGRHQEYVLTARGGTPSANLGYYLSAAYEDKEGFNRTNDLKKFTARANVNAQLRENLDVSSSMGFTHEAYTRGPEGGSVSFGILTGIIWGSPRTRNENLRGFLRAPWEETYKIKIGQRADHFTWSGTAEHRISDWFTQRLTVGTDVVVEEGYRLYPRMPEGSRHYFGAPGLGQRLVIDSRRENRTFDYAATAAFDLRSDLNSATSFGIQYYGRSEELLSAEGRIFPAPGLETVSAGSQKFADETFVENKTFGMFLQEKLAWRDRVFLTMAVRADDNSAFGVQVDPVFYPKVDAAWVLSEEPFWNVGFLPEFRLRGAWGVAGQQPDALASVRTYAPVAGTGGGAAIRPANPGNPKLKPERGQELELGFDASIWNRVSLAFTYYKATTKDAIILKDAPPSGGFSGSQFVNIGELASWGYELELAADVVKVGRFGWNQGLNLAHFGDKIVSLGGLPDINTGQGRQQIWHKEGYPIGGFWNKVIVQAEWDPATKRAVNILCAGEGGQGAVSCDSAPIQFIGGPGPYWDIVPKAALSFGNLRLNALFDIKLDQRHLNVQAYGKDYIFFNGWAITHPAEADPKYIAAIQLNNLGPLVERIDWLKLREIGVNYKLPSVMASRFFGASSVVLSLSGRNLWTIWRHAGDTACCNEAEQITQESWIRQTQTVPAPQALVIGGVTVTF